MKKLYFLIMMAISSVSAAQKNSLFVQVSYSNPEKFTDFETRLGSRSHLDELKNDLNRNINKLWKKAIDNENSLMIDFIDIDMAGRIYGVEQIREVRVNVDRSVIEFNYSIKNKYGKVIKSGYEKLVNNNLARLDRNTLKFDNSRLKYEVSQLRKWIRNIAKEIN